MRLLAIVHPSLLPLPLPPPPAPLLAPPVSGQHDLPFLRSAVLNVCGIVTQTHKRKGEAREEGRELERNWAAALKILDTEEKD